MRRITTSIIMWSICVFHSSATGPRVSPGVDLLHHVSRFTFSTLRIVSGLKTITDQALK